MRAKLKGKKKLIILLAVMAAAVIAASAVYSSTRSAASDVSDAQSYEVDNGTISKEVTGSGKLEAADKTEVKVPAGIAVESVAVEAGDTVAEGDTLAVLDAESITDSLVKIESSLKSVKDTLNSGSSLTALQKEQLNNQKADLEQAQSDLNKLKEDPTIKAPVSGIIGTVGVTEGSETAAGTAAQQTASPSGTDSSSETQSEGGSFTVQSADQTDRPAAELLTCRTWNTEGVKGNVPAVLFLTEESEGETGTQQESTVITDFRGLTGELAAPAAGQSMPTTDSLFKSGEGNADGSQFAAANHYTGTIRWNQEAETFQAGTQYVAVVTLLAQDGYIFSSGSVPQFAGALYQGQPVISEDGTRMQIQIHYPNTGSDETEQTSSGETAIGSGLPDYSALGDLSDSGLSDDALSAAGGSTDTGSQQANITYSDSQCTAFTILQGSQADVKISVDEQDILSVAEGQKATVTLDALEGQEFDGTVEKVASTATEGSSSAKYAVTVRIDMPENVKYGMSAQASIKVGEAENVPVIPMAALQQEGHKLFVYTKVNEDGSLGGEKEVKTGLSDGENVAVTSGLKKGDTIYYQYSGDDTQDFYTDVEEDGTDGDTGSEEGTAE
ncbi:MAG: HlyD family efflux transporter periplasmic adaptor subunit [Lachnospiraceae bacterium]